MPRTSTKDITKEDLVEKYRGVFVRNLDLATVVKKIIPIMNNYELQLITGETSAQITRLKNNQGNLKLESLEKLYDFYKETSKLPISTKENPLEEDYFALYTENDLNKAIIEIDNLFDTMETLAGNSKRKIISNLKVMKKNVTLSKQKENETRENIKNTENIDIEQKDTEQIHAYAIDNTTSKIKEYRTIEGNIVITDDGENFFLKPKEYLSDDDMRIVAGFEGDQNKDIWSHLTLYEKYVFEFRALISKMPFDETDPEYHLISNLFKTDAPDAFWGLHKKYGSRDNADIRNKVLAAFSLNEIAPPTNFKSIEDAQDWVSRKVQWLALNEDDNYDFNNYHSKEKFNLI